MKKNEAPDEALYREVFEETRIKINIISSEDTNLPVTGAMIKNILIPFHIEIHSVGNHNHCNLAYLCKFINFLDNKKNEKEIKEIKCFTKEDLRTENILENIRNEALVALSLYKQ